MRKEKPCKRILLAGTDDCRIVYCEGCAIAELALGAISVRLEESALHNLQAILSQALMNLSTLKAIKVSPDFNYVQHGFH